MVVCRLVDAPELQDPEICIGIGYGGDVEITWNMDTSEIL